MPNAITDYIHKRDRVNLAVIALWLALRDLSDTPADMTVYDLDLMMPVTNHPAIQRPLAASLANAPDQARRQPSPEAGCSPRSVLQRLTELDISNPSDKLPAQRRVRDATDSSWNKTAKRIHSALDANSPICATSPTKRP